MHACGPLRSADARPLQTAPDLNHASTSETAISPTGGTRTQVLDSLTVPSIEVVFPSSQEATDAFEAMVNDMVARIMTCSICNRQGHLSSGCNANMVCLIYSKPGHH